MKDLTMLASVWTDHKVNVTVNRKKMKAEVYYFLVNSIVAVSHRAYGEYNVKIIIY